MKINVWKVLLSSCREIELSSILPASFQKAAVLYEENRTFSRAVENIEPQNTKTSRSTQETNPSQLSSENVVRKFSSLDLIGNDVF